jgi:predicted Zn-dependent peptidase
METSFEKLPYRRQVLGTSSVIEQLNPQQMRDFHNYWYQPPSITAAVVGNLPVDELVEIVCDSFAQTYSPKSSSFVPDDLPLFPEPPFTDIVRREYLDETLQQARLVMLWRVPGLLELSETYSLDVLAAILGQGKVSRLFRDLREERGLVSQISVSNLSHRVQGVFCVSAQLSTENIPAVEKAIAEHLRQIQDESVTEAEMRRIRTQVVNRFIFGNERPSDRANLYGYYHSQLGDLEPALNYPSYIQSLEVSDIQTATQRYLSPDAYGLVIIKPL